MLGLGLGSGSGDKQQPSGNHTISTTVSAMYNDNKLAARELEIARNTDKLIRGHDKVTNGKVRL